MLKLTVKTRFFITRTPIGELYAEAGDVLTVRERGDEHYLILKINDKPVYSIWQRKAWVLAKCQPIKK